jgi:hypothetical protein
LVAGSARAVCITPSITPAAIAPMRGRALRNVVLVIRWICMAVAPSARQFSCHHSGRPPHARAPHAGRMTLLRQVSWLAGHDPPPPSRALSAKPSDILEKGSPLTVAGAAPDLARCQRNGEPHRIPFLPINPTGTPERDDCKLSRVYCQHRYFIFVWCVTFR